jgi:hypothetical protein
LQSSNDDAVVSLVVDASGLRQGSVEAVALGKRIIDSFKAIENAAGSVTGAVSVSGAGIVKSLGDTNRFLGQIERSLNPLAAAANKAQVEMDRLIGIMGGTNVAAAQRASQALELQAQKVLGLKNALALASTENKALEATYVSLTQAFERAVNGLSSLISKYQPASASAKQMTGELASLNQAFKAGLVTEEQYVGMNSKIVGSYNEEVVAAQRLAEARAKLISSSRADQNAQTAQLGIQKITEPVAGPDFTRDLQAQMQAANEITQAQNEIIQAQEAAETKSKAVTQQVLIDNYNRANSYKQEIAQLQIRAEAENKAFDSKKITDAANRLDYLTQKFNQDATAVKNYQKTMSELNELMATGTLDWSNYSAQMNRAIDAYNSTTVAGQKAAQGQKGFSGAMVEGEHSSRLMQYTLTNLSFQVNDVVSGLVMGQTPFRIFAQQAGQFVQVFQQGGGITKVVTEAAQAVGKWTMSLVAWVATPVGAAVTASVALAGAFAVIFTRSVSNELQLRRFEAVLRDIVPQFNTSSVALQKLSYDLRAVGVASADAEKGIVDLARNSNVNLQNPNAVRSLATLGVNVGARLGIGDAAGIAKVNEALNAQSDAVVKLGLDTKAFTVAEAAEIAIQIQRGNGVKAVGDAMALLTTRLVAEHEKQRNGFSQFFDAVGSGWNTLVNKITDSSLFTGIDSLFKHMADNLKYIIDNGELAANSQIGRIFSGPTRSEATPGRSQRAAEMQRLTFGSALNSGGALTGSNSTLSDLTAANVNNKDIQDLNSEFAQRINNFLNAEAAGIIVNSAARFGSHPSSFNSGGTGLHNADILGQGLAVDLGNLSSSSASRLQNFGLHQTVPGDWGHIEPIEIPTANQATGAARMAAGRNFISSNSGMALATSRLPQVPSFDANLIKESNTALSDFDKTLERDNRLKDTAITNEKLWNIQKTAETAASAKYNELIGSGTDKFEAWRLANVEFDKTRETALIDLSKQNELTQMGIKVQNDATEGFKIGTSEGFKREALQQAQIESRQTGITVEQAYSNIVRKAAADAVRGASETTAAMTPEIAAQERLIQGLNKGAAAGHEAELQNQAIAATQQAINRAGVDGSKVTEAQIQQEIKLNLEKTKRLDLDKSIANFKQQDIQDQNTMQVLRAEIGLQGQTSQEIARQTSLIQVKQELDAKGIPINNEEYQKRLQIVDALGKTKIALDDAQRAQARLEEGLKSIADQIGSGLLTAIDGIFDKSKVTNWADTFRQALTSIGNQLLQMTLIKPLTGSIFSALGFGNLAQQFGTFGSLFGGSSSGTSGTGSIGLTQTGTNSQGQPTFSLSNIGTVGGIAKDAFSLFGGSGSSSSSGLFGGLFGDIGGSISSSLVGEAGPLIGAEGLAGGGIGTSGLLGSGGSLFGVAGLGLSSVLPVLGIAAGIGSLLFGSLFNKKPSNFASGGVLDFTKNNIFGVNSAGNSQSDATSKQILTSVSTFINTLTTALPGTLVAGSLNTNVGTRDGIRIAGSIGNAGSERGTLVVSEGVKFGSAEEAIKAVEMLALHYLEGNVSSTARTVLDSLTDPNQLQDALQFITVYDNLKRQFDSAFDSIATDAKKIGPFEQAFNQIGTIFDDLTTKANTYGLSLAPINAGLEEAHRRLREDLYKSISDAELAINDPIQLLIRQEKEAGKARVDDAIAIGARVVEVNKLNADRLDEIWKNQTQTLIDLENQLKTGTLSGLTIGGQISAANDNVQRELRLVKGGNLGEISNLVTNAQSEFQLSQTAFGNAPQTATLRNELITAFDDILGHRTFAGGTDSTPSGMILVGENGPEWMVQNGGNKIYPNGTGPSLSSPEMISLLKELVNEVRGVNMVGREHGRISERGFKQVTNTLDKKKLEVSTRTRAA